MSPCSSVRLLPVAGQVKQFAKAMGSDGRGENGGGVPTLSWAAWHVVYDWWVAARVLRCRFVALHITAAMPLRQRHVAR